MIDDISVTFMLFIKTSFSNAGTWVFIIINLFGVWETASAYWKKYKKNKQSEQRVRRIRRGVNKELEVELKTLESEEETNTTKPNTKAATQPRHSNPSDVQSAAHICWTCHLPGSSLLKCSGCKKARYCGETCYREDWGRHREWCGKRRERREQRRGDMWGGKSERLVVIGERDEVD